jgi:hypothetical protein
MEELIIDDSLRSDLVSYEYERAEKMYTVVIVASFIIALVSALIVR